MYLKKHIFKLSDKKPENNRVIFYQKNSLEKSQNYYLIRNWKGTIFEKKICEP